MLPFHHGLPIALAVVLFPQQVALALSDRHSCNASSLLQATVSVSSVSTWIAKEAHADAASLLSYASTVARSREVASAWLSLAHRRRQEATFGPLIVLAAGVVMTSVVACFWFCAWRHRARMSEGLQADGMLEPKPMETTTDSKQEADAANWTVHWLRCLVIATFATIGIQVTLGALARSVTLLGDLGHTAADAITYLFASVVEAAKADLGRRGTAILDLLSAIFSMLVVCSSSFYATEVAIRRLQEQQDDNEAGFGLIGFALLSFAIITTCVNTGILVMHMWYKPKAQAAQDTNDAAITKDSPADSRPGRLQCPQCVAAGGVQRMKRVGFIRDTSVPDGSSASTSAASASQTAPDSDQAWIKSTVHAFVHPGCVGQCQIAPQAGSSEKGSLVESLNEYGVLLHLGADVVRSIVIFVTGVLLIAKVIPSPSAADAITSLIVVSCVLVGSFMIVTRMPRCLHDALYG
mmetsp:Transcript_8127/g.18088  ORF Transcript_8127/g.18088 Transcript_8127/m.18088 type:complete len:466 (-) Transcript_8127:61-1458(-)